MESLFKLMPDTSPCDMAIICRKPCFEVLPPLSRVLFPRYLIIIIIIILNQIYIHRKLESIFSDEKILENQQPPIKHAKKKISKFLKSCIAIYIFGFNLKISRRRHRQIFMVRVHIGSTTTRKALQSFFFRTVTCHHLGPCNQYTNCICYNTPQGCQRMCSCAKNCK